MKNKTAWVLGAFLMSGVVYAECPDNLKAEQMVECLTIEGAGANYQDWLADFSQPDAGVESSGAISPITGKDIRATQPAAGGQKK